MNAPDLHGKTILVTGATGIWGHGAPDSTWKRAVFAGVMAPVKAFMLTPERGAQTIVRAATSPDLEGDTSPYLGKNRPIQPAPLALDDTLAERLWQESARLTHLEDLRFQTDGHDRAAEVNGPGLNRGE